MAVQVFNDMPDAEVHRGEPVFVEKIPLREPVRRTRRVRSRAGFIAGTIAVHIVLLGAFVSAQRFTHVVVDPQPLLATIIDAPQAPDEKPPEYVPPPDVQYVLPMPQEITVETEAITLPEPVQTAAIANPGTSSVVPPMIESVEYVRPPKPVYPNESNRRHERGTVLLRVLIDPAGRPAQIAIERSSGFERLDVAAREAVENALFHPHEVNGIAQAAQVFIPIEFKRRAG